MNWTGRAEIDTLDPITNDGFYPDLEVGEFVGIYRIPSEVKAITIINALKLAIVEINVQLKPFKALIATATLDDYCTAHPYNIGDESVLIAKYKEAVFCYAKSQLFEQIKSFVRKQEAENLAKEAPETREYWLNRSIQAVQFLFNEMNIDKTPTMSGNVAVYLV